LALGFGLWALGFGADIFILWQSIINQQLQKMKRLSVYYLLPNNYIEPTF
jgi:hypothetical protein